MAPDCTIRHPVCPIVALQRRVRFSARSAGFGRGRCHQRRARRVPWCITLDNSKGISRLRFWAKNSRVNGINDLPVFMHQGNSSTLNTSFIERLNLTIRQSSAYLSRRTLSHARSTERLDEHLELLRYYYNFVRPHGALKFGREIRTPAVQAGLTTRRLTFRDIFLATTIPLWPRIEVFVLSRARNPVSSAPVPLPAAA